MKSQSVGLPDLAKSIAAKQPWLIEQLRALVEVESPSDEPAAVDRKSVV